MIKFSQFFHLLFLAVLFNYLALPHSDLIASQDISGEVKVVRSNFIRLDTGSASGIRTDQTAIVIRDGRYIALIRITSVEEHTAVAKILENKVDINQGDSVIIGDAKDVIWKIDKLKQSVEEHYRRRDYKKVEKLCEEILKLAPDNEFAKNTLEGLPKIGSLKITSDPSGARVFINSNSLGVTPIEMNYPVGKYSLWIDSEGWQRETVRVSIVKDKTTIITARLKKELPARPLPGDIGRTYEKELDFADFQKQEDRQVFRKAPAGLKILNDGLLALAAAGAVASIGLFFLAIADNREDGPYGKAGLITSVAGFGLASLQQFSEDKVHKYEEQPVTESIPENIAYNNRKRQAILKYNEQVEKENETTAKMIDAEYQRRLAEVERFNNKNREVRVQVK